MTFDDVRARRAAELLRDLAHDFQVLYLTTSDRYDSVADSVLELPGPTLRDDVGGAPAAGAPVAEPPVAVAFRVPAAGSQAVPEGRAPWPQVPADRPAPWSTTPAVVPDPAGTGPASVEPAGTGAPVSGGGTPA